MDRLCHLEAFKVFLENPKSLYF